MGTHIDDAIYLSEDGERVPLVSVSTVARETEGFECFEGVPLV